jgi:hypothetical protein
VLQRALSPPGVQAQARLVALHINAERVQEHSFVALQL